MDPAMLETLTAEDLAPPTPPPSYEESASGAASRVASGPKTFNLKIDRTAINTVGYSSANETSLTYRLSHELDTGHSTIAISRFAPFTNSPEFTGRRDKHIYSFTQSLFSTTVEIIGKRRSTLPGTLYLRLNHSFLKQSWEVCHRPPTSDRSTLLFRTRPTRNPHKVDKLQWEDAERQLVAVETQWCANEGSKPGLHVVKNLGDKLVDVLVTGWCAKIWNGWQMSIAEAREKELDSFRRKMAYGGQMFSIRDSNPGTSLWSL
ncbi:hypothetical protein D8B26_001372 [Coccidioides posadasii str. Silveira]|uniref:Uncharacterized protein n=1 Tax=Coccidioides posadasii (strain RMSCC 757 / Silveira) TaxID=443226 RepID=E9D9Q6_COCPS|nr:conserved hypothetical protein [Coccidioides posadasii str. Silveira]QVM06665.1 hypothetical protein D8B26_001372 [Coccidioides posadasii str. Silveira]